MSTNGDTIRRVINRHSQGFQSLSKAAGADLDALLAEIERLRAALERIAESQPDYGPVTEWHEACITVAEKALAVRG